MRREAFQVSFQLSFVVFPFLTQSRKANGIRVAERGDVFISPKGVRFRGPTLSPALLAESAPLFATQTPSSGRMTVNGERKEKERGRRRGRQFGAVNEGEGPHFHPSSHTTRTPKPKYVHFLLLRVTYIDTNSAVTQRKMLLCTHLIFDFEAEYEPLFPQRGSTSRVRSQHASHPRGRCFRLVSPRVDEEKKSQLHNSTGHVTIRGVKYRHNHIERMISHHLLVFW